MPWFLAGLEIDIHESSQINRGDFHHRRTLNSLDDHFIKVLAPSKQTSLRSISNILSNIYQPKPAFYSSNRRNPPQHQTYLTPNPSPPKMQPPHTSAPFRLLVTINLPGLLLGLTSIALSSVDSHSLGETIILFRPFSHKKIRLPFDVAWLYVLCGCWWC